ncbi:nmrA-like family domain-containing protein 1, partial [Orbicella faveolata]|uniref:nmrA-like family domain-containing protein 1 n=1 Tax=Orbicella faveolata TaxID=48498 RepID=UPI0009E2CB70
MAPAHDHDQVITVFGATGGQGGGVVSALLKAISRGEDYAVRAVTRDPDGTKAQNLKSKGCEVVKCDMDDKASVEEALKGSYGVFLVTNYWEHFSKEKEIDQGKRVIDVCEALGVKHLIYSGLENVKKQIGIDCAHFDSKGIVEEYLHGKKLKERLPFTIVRFSFYFNNLASMMKPRKTAEHTYVFDIPMHDVPMDGIDVT